MVVIDRVANNNSLPEGELAELEDIGGYALLRAMKNFEFPAGGEQELEKTIRDVLREHEELLSAH